MSNVFEQYLLKKDNGVRRRIIVDSSLYEKLAELSKRYEASINKMVNVSIMGLIDNQKVTIYPRPANETTEPHNFLIRESSYKELEKMKEKYGLSIFKLINIAIYNAVNF